MTVLAQLTRHCQSTGLAFVLFGVFLPTHAATGQTFGTYSGPVQAEWLPDGRTMRLLSSFVFVDPFGTEWEAPAGWVVDGASIPSFAWSTVGGPYSGKYRHASVIHDVACVRKTRRWQDVHLAFYYGMRASGVGVVRAKIMYAAVYHLGPRWPETVQRQVPSEAVDAELAKVAAAAGQQASAEIVEVTDHVIEGYAVDGSPQSFPTGLKSVKISINPNAPVLDEESFKGLEAAIEAGDLSLDAIRDYTGTPQ